MTIKQFSQTDPQWKSNVLGFDKSATIGAYGCLLTSMTMCATHYGATDLTPALLNEKMKAINGFQAGTAYIVGWLIGNVVPGMSLDYRQCGGAPAPIAEIDSRLAMNLPVIIEVDYSPSAGVQTHYMVAYAKEGNDYLVYDPYPFPVTSGQIKLSQSKYATLANSKDPAKIITGVFFTRGPAKVDPPAPPKLDNGVYASFPVYATADDLALRSQTVIADFTLLKRFPANTEFKVLEADATAGPKIGQNNVWVPVKAPDGTVGYTAAWLVSKSKSTAAPAPNTAPVAVPVPKDAPVVKTNVDALKLRSKPDSTDATILKVYPIGTELKVLETAEAVKRKVGTMYEWLSVADVEGKQGVVAAWYVAIVSLGAFGPSAQRQTSGPNFGGVGEELPVILRTTEEGVALRVKPFISKNTLIYRLPKDAELIAQGKAAVAARKIGKTGQWIRVKDVKGNRGYVAAWLVKERPEDPVPQVSPKDC
jgi:hypothetical protein